jgi:glycosyltransferase involved in cell wall biosynthesis
MTDAVTSTRDAIEPMVSILMPCYNSERFLEGTLASVMSQTYSNWELIAVDDCSTDGTRAMLDRAAAQDPRVRIFGHTQRGGRPAVTKNTALREVRGEFLCFLDHDDLYLPRKLEVLVDALQKRPNCVAGFHDLDFVDAAGQVTDRYLPNFLNDAKMFLQQIGEGRFLVSQDFYRFQSIRYAALHTISCMLAIKRLPACELRFDTRYAVCDDTDLWIRVGLCGTMVYCDERLAHYRQHESNITRDLSKFHLDVTMLIETNIDRMRGKLDRRALNAMYRRLASHYESLGYALRKDGRPGAAAAYLKALRLEPRWHILMALAKAWLPVRPI